MSLTRPLSDTLCTVIAAGFISLNPNLSYVYDKAEDGDVHNELSARLHALGIPVRFHMQDPKEESPYIAAQTKYIPDAVAKGVVDDLLRKTAALERTINSTQMPVALRGAYIGGMDNLTRFELLGPSDLYLYPPQYRTDTNGVQPSYETAKRVSNLINIFLKDYFPGVAASKTFRIVNSGTIDANYEPNRLFGSVHGMIRALTHYYTGDFSENLCLELALGRDTCKVASCLPCSLFMSSNGTPATATHLGRGDNWNLPKDMSSIHQQRQAWRRYVIEAYQTGLEHLHTLPNVDAWMKYLPPTEPNMEHIPGLFLEALTFEGAFTDKMLATLHP